MNCLCCITICHSRFFKLILVIVLIVNDVASWNYYRSYRQVDGPKVCTFIKCKADERCVNRKFGCKYPPCPNMIYCAKTHIESLRGPSSCDTVHCSKGHTCIVKVRHCKWNEPCGEQLARCITEMEYHNGPASCAGYRCPAGHDCILRESFCIRPPCKLLRSCVTRRDYQRWLGKCKVLGCISSHECFLRRPGNVCESPPCRHTPDCTITHAARLLTMDEKCRGWICPQNQTCEAGAQEEPCENFDCKIFRTCHDQFNNHDNKDDNNDEDDKKKRLQNSTQTLAHLRTELPQLNTKNEDNTILKYPKSTEKSLFNNVNPTLSSLSLWIDYLQNETGIEAVKKWVRNAEEDVDYAGFHKWLESVKELLGVKAYGRWLEEIRDITASSKAFQLWLPVSSILKFSNSHQSSATGNNNDIEQSTIDWSSSGNDSKKGIYSTHSLMNPLYQRQNIDFLPSNVPRVIPYLFAPGNREDGNSGRHYGYYILPPLHYSPDGHENSPEPRFESNQQDIIRQLINNSGNADATKRADLVDLLQKLKEERLLYEEVINKTKELVGRARPLLPVSHLDEFMRKLQGIEPQMSDFDDSLSVAQRLLPEELKNDKNQQNSSDATEVIEKSNDVGSSSDDYSSDDETEFFLVDYNDPSTLDMNQTLPRILIKVEKNLDSSMSKFNNN